MADDASEVSRSRNVKNMFERNSTDVLIMVEFSQKIHSLPRVVFDTNCGELSCCSIPFCDRGVFRISARRVPRVLTKTYTF